MSDAPPPRAEVIRDATVIKPSMSRRAVGALARHFWGLARWKKALLVLAIAMSVVGAAGSVRGSLQSKPPEVREAQVTVEALQTTAKHSSLTSEQNAQLETAKAKVAEVRHWFYDQTAPQLWRMGIGFFVAFVLGYAFRQFVKTMATLTAVVLVGAGVAAYFGYLNVGDVKTNLSTGTGWMMDQMDGVKATMLKFIGASLTGTIGFVIGFMRR